MKKAISGYFPVFYALAIQLVLLLGAFPVSVSANLGSNIDAQAVGSRNMTEKGPDISGLAIEEKLGESIDLDLRFVSEAGEEVPLRKYFGGKKPVIVSMAYYECPTLCGIVLNGLLEVTRKMDWTPGEQYTLVNVSIDPREKHELAATKKKSLMEALDKPGADAGWHFLTGDESQIKSLASQLGFGYRWDENEKQYAHSAGIFVLTPEGKLSRILYGIQYKPSDLRLSLLEAADGKIGTILDRIVLFCFSYNPQMKQYSMVLTQVMKVGAIITVLILGAFIAFARMRELRGSS
jgi:protein SCO1/2